MDVLFKTKPTSHTLGTPTRARPCRCGRQVVDMAEGRCVSCGHVPKELIDRAWADQAYRTRKSSRRSVSPFREGLHGRLYRQAA